MVIKVEKKHICMVANLAILMWDNHSVNDLINEFSDMISKGKTEFLLRKAIVIKDMQKRC